MVGRVTADSRAQTGHWRSTYCVRVSGALGSPSTPSRSGSPANRAAACLPALAAVARSAVPCEDETRAATTTSTAATAAAAPRRMTRRRRAADWAAACSAARRAARRCSTRSPRVEAGADMGSGSWVTTGAEGGRAGAGAVPDAGSAGRQRRRTAGGGLREGSPWAAPRSGRPPEDQGRRGRRAGRGRPEGAERGGRHGRRPENERHEAAGDEAEHDERGPAAAQRGRAVEGARDERLTAARDGHARAAD